MEEDRAKKTGAINVTKKEVTCKLCGKFYSSPKLVECLHSFCQACIQQHLSKEEAEHIFVCPKCLHVTKTGDPSAASLTSDLHVPRLLEVFKCHLTSVTPCIICTLEGNVGEATHRCLSCNDHLCTACSKKHTFSSLTATHKVVSLSDVRSGKYDQDIMRKNTLLCKEHDQENCEFFCNTCSWPQCTKCIITKHKDHSYVSIEDATETKKSEVLSLLQDCKESPCPESKDIAVVLAELDLLQKDETMFVKTVNERTELIIKTIKQQSKDCLQKAKTMFKEERTRREMKKDVVLKRSERRQHILRLCVTLANDGGREIVEMGNALKKGLTVLSNDVLSLNTNEKITTYKASISFPPDDKYFEVLQVDMTQSQSPTQDDTTRQNDAQGFDASTFIPPKGQESQAKQKHLSEKSTAQKDEADKKKKKTQTEISPAKQKGKASVNSLSNSPETICSEIFKLKFTFSSKLPSEGKSANICSTAFCKTDRFIVLDKANAKLKFYKMNGDMMFLVHVTGKCKPFQQFVHIVPGNCVVAVHEHVLYILTIHLQNEKSIELLPKDKLKSQPRVANFAQDILVGNLPENEMRVYNTSGKLLRRWTSKMQGPFQFLKYAEDDRVLSSNWEGTGSVSLESEKKGLLVQITGQMRLGLPWRPADGVVDKEGHVIVSDPNRNELSVFSSNGSPLIFYDTSADAVSQPKCLFLDNDGLVYVSYKDGRIAAYLKKRG